MNEKVKVSREVAEAIDFVTNVAAFQFKEVMAIMVEGGFSRPENEKAYPLNELPIKQIAAILINGYEIEETPEEILLNRFMQNSENRTKAIKNKNVYQEGYALGYSLGVQDGLNFSGIKIKGIND